MMRTRIKICCIASGDEARLAIEAGADAIGFVCAGPLSPRTIADSTAAEIIQATPPTVGTVVLTTERTAEAIAAQVRRIRPTTVQILAHIDPAQSARLAELDPYVRKVQAIHVESRAALDLIAAYSAHVDAFLLDSGRPDAATPEYGGTGRQHDWAISAEFVQASKRPVFLAGGLTSANVADAIRQVRPFGVDLCSGVRTEGRLDRAKLTEFVLAVRNGDDSRRRA